MVAIRRDRLRAGLRVQLKIFKDRGLAVENMVLALMSIAFVPFFFFASVYAQVSLGNGQHRCRQPGTADE
jgi:hypothetical protein